MKSEDNFQESELSLHHASENELSPQTWQQVPLPAEHLTCSVMNFLSLVFCSMPTPGWQWVISSSGLFSLVYPPEDRVEQSVGGG